MQWIYTHYLNVPCYSLVVIYHTRFIETFLCGWLFCACIYILASCIQLRHSFWVLGRGTYTQQLLFPDHVNLNSIMTMDRGFRNRNHQRTGKELDFWFLSVFPDFVFMRRLVT